MGNTMLETILGNYPNLRYIWLVEYTDGTAISQFDPEDFHENLWRDIDQTKIRSCSWLPLVPLLPTYKVILTDGQRLILFRRSYITYTTGGVEVKREIQYVLGWQTTLPDSGNVKTMMFINEDGNCILSSEGVETG